MPLRVGIVGANPDYGWGSGVHRRVVQMLPGFTLQGVCTTREESSRRAAAAFNVPLAFTDFVALADHPEIDIVAVCVRAPAHYEIARAAIAAGKHVYCEWPLAVSVAQADELAGMAQERGVKAMIGLHLRGSPAMRQAAALIAGGYIGKLYGVNLNARLFGPIMRAMAMRAAGTTLLSIYGGHLLDALDHYFGGIADITARSAIHLPPIDENGAAVARDAADHVLFQGALAQGGLFSIDMGGVSMTGMGCHWRIDGSDGYLILSARDPSIPAIEAISLHGARNGGPAEAIAIDRRFDCAAIPDEPDRYAAYPASFAAREALSAIGNLYSELGMAIRTDGPVIPDFHRAARIQRLLAHTDSQAIPSPRGNDGAEV